MGLKKYNIDAIYPYFNEEDIVIYGVLNWGLGHATRSIPFIEWLQKRCKKVIITSDGAALSYLKNCFTQGNFEELPSYDIQYKYESIALNVAASSLSIMKAIKKESKDIKRLTEKYQANKVVSDNRLGFYSSGCTNFYITHQVNIHHNFQLLSFFGSLAHRLYYNKFDKILIPDFSGTKALSSLLSHTTDKDAIYLGPLTRINKLELNKTIDVLVILSGPEPQRSILEKGLLKVLNDLEAYKVFFIRGTEVKSEFIDEIKSHIKIKNVSLTTEIEYLLNSCNLLISRSGYSTIMDTFELDIPIIWIPTPGQSEQEYLANIHGNMVNNKSLNQNELNKLQGLIVSMI